MAYNADEWLDRQRLKRRLTFWRIAGVVAVAVALIALIAPWGEEELTDSGPYIAEVVLEGMIQEDPELVQALSEAAEDDQVKALILRVNSPGGTVVGGESIYNALRRLAKTKPVVAEMGTLATSGGYMVSLAADRIFAHQGTITGSIGVILQTATIADALDSIGIQSQTYRSGPLKAQPNPLEHPGPEVSDAMMGLITDMYGLFTEMVAERRNIPLDQVKVLADGRVYTGRQALENGLIDEIGGRHESLAWLRTKPEISDELEVLPLPIGYDDDQEWVVRFGRAVGKALISEGLTLDGLAAVWQPSL